MTSLYVHIPFCQKKCFYCSFVVSIEQQQRIDQYLDCLAVEAQKYKGEAVKTIYIGGGTPTFLNEKQLARLVVIIKDNFSFPSSIEWTIEANPEGLSIEKLKKIRSLDINRISLGIQSLNDDYLKYLGRNHDRQKAICAYQLIRDAGFDNVSLDLMYTFPQQSLGELEQDVYDMIQLDSEHVSLYALTIEENSRFYVRKVQLNDDEYQARQYILTTKLLEQAGFKQYEVSNFAKDGRESAHNINYWLGGNYIGLGIGAHSHMDGKRFWNIPKLTEYIRRLEKGQSPIADTESLETQERLMETFLLGLRMNKGVCLSDMEEQFGCDVGRERRQIIDEFVENGLLLREGDLTKASPKGRLVLNELCARLI